MANNSKRNSNRAGAVLITVLTVACFAAILLTAVLTFVKRAHTNAFNNYNSEQAYYIASSALGSVHDYFEKQKDLNYPDLVAYANASPTGTEGTITLGDSAIDSVIPGGDCKVNISKVNDGYIKLSVTGYYNGQAETINAYYAVTPGKKSSGIDNALYSNGTANFDKQCSNTGSVTTGGDYKVTNGSSSSGSIICGRDFMIAADGYHWVSDPNGLASSYIVTQGSFFVKNTNATFIPNISKKDDNTSLFISIGRAFFGNVSMTIGNQDSDNEMDLYCNTAFLGKGPRPSTDYYIQEYSGTSHAEYLEASGAAVLKMCGNLYCYKIEDNESHDYNNPQDGDLIINVGTAGLDIEGDVFVEGNIIFRQDNYNQGVTIKKLNSSDPNSRGGTLYVSPDTKIISEKGALTDSSKIECYAISGAGLTYEKVKGWIDAGVLKFTGITNPTEDNLKDRILTEPINHGSATSRNYKPAVEFDPNYVKTYETTQEFLNRPDNATIKGKYEHAMFTNLKDYKTSYHDAGLDLDFQYYVDGTKSTDGGNGCIINEQTLENDTNKFANGRQRVFVDMDQISGDYVIRVNGSMIKEEWWPEHKFVSVNQMYMPTIVVKNGTRNDDGTWTNDKGEGCLYIILDSTAPNAEIMFMKTGIIDYYTYKYVVQKNYGLNIGGYGKGGNSVNELNKPDGYTDPNGQVTGIYTPARTRIFLMLNPGDNMSTQNINARESEEDKKDLGLIEAVVYAPQASCKINTYGYKDLLYLRDPSKYELSYLSLTKTLVEGTTDQYIYEQKACLAILGAIICETFDGDENFGVGFIPPSTETNLGGGGGSEDVGTVAFSHYESR